MNIVGLNRIQLQELWEKALEENKKQKEQISKLMKSKVKIELTDEEIEIIAVNLTKNKYGVWYHNGDDSTAYYKGIIDGIHSVIKRRK